MAATIRVLRDVPGCVRGDHDSTHVQPDDYLAATSELIFLSLAVAWIITWFTNPQVIASNPLKDRIGYNNPCVGWDDPPALYVAAFMMQSALLCAIRYAVLDLIRARQKLRSREIAKWQFEVTRAASIFTIVGMFLTPLLFVVTPKVSPEWHTSLYGVVILSRYAVVAGNFVENRDEHISTIKYVYLFVYGSISFTLMACLFLNFYNYRGNEEAYARGDRPVPASIGMVVDYSWFACLVITGPFLPTYYELQITYKLHPQETK
mmetsp:Transcript_18130/g.56610  ORF Transcript_18130/g.56610 Transcript_18130/m.56610 type:complete len:263 (-) Transcript_18130:127-915(-)